MYRALLKKGIVTRSKIIFRREKNLEVVQKKIRISLQTIIENNGDKEVLNNAYRGNYIHRGNVEVITYTEHVEGLGETNNRITIHPNKINIKRSGQIKMNQQFIMNKRTETLYRHPFGNMMMEIITKKMMHRPL